MFSFCSLSKPPALSLEVKGKYVKRGGGKAGEMLCNRGGRKSPIQFGNTHLRDRCIQRTVYCIIHKQNSFELYFKRSSRLNAKGFLVKIYFLHKILGIFEFLICICKIKCKPIGNFAENLNIGKRVPLPAIQREQCHTVNTQLRSCIESHQRPTIW